MNLSDEMLIEISYVEISQYRKKVMKSLEGDVKIPTAIANDSGIITNHISKVLGELKEHELVECINPEVRKGRLYRLSDTGLNVLNELKSQSGLQFDPEVIDAFFEVYPTIKEIQNSLPDIDA